MRPKFDILFDEVDSQFGYSHRRTQWHVYVIGMLRNRVTEEDIEQAKDYFRRLGGDINMLNEKERKEGQK